MEGIGFRDRIHEFTALGVQILGVSTDSVAANAAFAQHYAFPFPLLSDGARAICTAYETCGAVGDGAVERVTYIIGPGGRIEQVIARRNAQEHPVAVLRYLHEARQTGRAPVAPVYALGALGYDFGTTARRAFLSEVMAPGNPYIYEHLLRYLDDNPQEAEQIIWTLNQDQIPLYALRPTGSFARDSYQEFWQFLNDQLAEGVERISVPGLLRGQATLLSGQVVPVIEPVEHGLYSWTTAALIQAVHGDGADEALRAATSNFLARIYHELRNKGQTSQERALNYAATNAFQAGQVFQLALAENLALKTITAEPSALCRPDVDCWDVLLTFFEPGNRFKRAEKIYRYTIDVSDVIPVPVGEVRSWYMYTPAVLV